MALSCGGAVALEARDGEAMIVTVFAGDPGGELNSFARFQHKRWGFEDAVNERRREDQKARGSPRRRSPLAATSRTRFTAGSGIPSDDDLFGPVKPGDAELTERVTASLLCLVEELARPRVYLPLTAGRPRGSPNLLGRRPGA